MMTRSLTGKKHKLGLACSLNIYKRIDKHLILDDKGHKINLKTRSCACLVKILICKKLFFMCEKH